MHKLDSEVTVSITGELSDAATDLVFSHPEIAATQQLEPAHEFRTVHRRPRTFDIRVGPEVPAGLYEVRAVGPTGLSGPRAFMVSDLEETRFEPEGKTVAMRPLVWEWGKSPLLDPARISGDYYRFIADAGEPLLVQVWAQRLDSQMDPVLAVFDADGKTAWPSHTRNDARSGAILHTSTRRRISNRSPATRPIWAGTTFTIGWR